MDRKRFREGTPTCPNLGVLSLSPFSQSTVRPAASRSSLGGRVLPPLHLSSFSVLQRQPRVKSTSHAIGFKPDLLCDLEQGSVPLWGLVSPPVK